MQPAVTEKALIELPLSRLLITLTSRKEECSRIVLNFDKKTSSFPLLLCLILSPSPWVELSAYRVGAERGGRAGPVMGVKGQKSLLANTGAHLRPRERGKHMLYFFSSKVESAVV